MTSEALTMYLILEHGGITVSVPTAAGIVGIGKEQAYGLIAQRRFPVVGTTSGQAGRESMRVLLPRLVEWMYAGGTRQYDNLPPVSGDTSKLGRGKDHDHEMDWLDAQLPVG